MKKMKSVLALVAMCFMFVMPLTASLVHEGEKTSVVLQVNEARAQSEATAPAPAVDEPAQPTYLDGVLKAIGESSAIIAGLLMVFEFILRVVPSAKPLSLLVPAQYAFSGLGAIFTFLGGLVKQLIEVANRTKK